MRMSIQALVSAVLVGAVTAGASSHGAHLAKRHHDLAVREPRPEPIPEPIEERSVNVTHQFSKRFSNAKFSFYDVGLGACGQTSSENEFIVALNTPQYYEKGSQYPGPECFKSITISYGGKTTQATIMDQCPGCPYGGLDFSRGLFRFFASESEGIIYGEWTFNDGSGSGGNTNPTTTSSSSTPEWTPPPSTSQAPTTSSSVWTPPTTSSSSVATTTSSEESTSTSVEPTTSSSTESTSSSETTSSEEPTSSLELSSGIHSGLGVVTGSGELSIPTGTTANIQNLNIALIDLGALVNAGAQLP